MYLRKNPDFLIQHPDVLDAVQLPHESGAAVSLIERQVGHLRELNHGLSKQMKQLVQIASDNEQLMNRLHQLTLELMIIRDLGSFFDRLCLALMNEFNADILNISLFNRKVEVSDGTSVFMVNRDDPDVQQFQAQLDKGESVCGRLNSKKLEFLYGSRAQWVGSTALVPLGQDGLLAIGSSDPAHFYPGMGTLFLDLLATVIACRLALSEPEEQRRSA